MKRTLSIILALLMWLSLCACSEKSNNGISFPKGMTKEEMLNNAEIFDVAEWKSDMKKNQMAAQEKYEGNVYIISAFVETVENNKCTLAFFIDPNVGASKYYVIAPFDKETLLTLNVGERINLVGAIKSVEDQRIFLDSAYYLDNYTELTIEIGSNIYLSVSDKLPWYCIADIQGYVDDMISPYCIVNLDGEVLADLNEGDEVIVRGKLSILGDSVNLYEYKDKYVGLEMNDAEIVE